MPKLEVALSLHLEGENLSNGNKELFIETFGGDKMKITKSQLRQLIREEVNKVLLAEDLDWKELVLNAENMTDINTAEEIFVQHDYESVSTPELPRRGISGSRGPIQAWVNILHDIAENEIKHTDPQLFGLIQQAIAQAVRDTDGGIDDPALTNGGGKTMPRGPVSYRSHPFG